MKQTPPRISPAQSTALLTTLQHRFEKNMKRHAGLSWDTIQNKLETAPEKIDALFAMENTGGEPDVIGYDKKTNTYIFCDCATESPSGRRSVCYDRAALDARKENKPKDTAHDMAAALGITLLTEDQYRSLQTLGNFDTKTSSRIQTPPAIRSLGGALFCDRRYDTVFTYHNGADSYYAARGFRGTVSV